MAFRGLILLVAVVAMPAQAQAQMQGERGIRPATGSGDATRVAPAREALTTTQSDQASLRRQRVLEQSQKAGC